MSKLNPYFEVNGNHYEIKRTRFILAEYDKMREKAELSADDQQNILKIQNMMADVNKYAKKVSELEEKYFETFDDEDERRYLKAKSLYEDTFNKLAALEAESGSTQRVQKASIDLLEKIAIKAIAEQYFDMNESLATEVWESFVDEMGNDNIVEWLTAMADCLFIEREETEENSFLKEVRRKNEQKKALQRR